MLPGGLAKRDSTWYVMKAEVVMLDENHPLGPDSRYHCAWKSDGVAGASVLGRSPCAAYESSVSLREVSVDSREQRSYDMNIDR